MSKGKLNRIYFITTYQWTDNNPKLDLDNINAYSKFGYKALLFTEVIVRKRKYGCVSGRQLCKNLTKFAH